MKLIISALLLASLQSRSIAMELPPVNLSSGTDISRDEASKLRNQALAGDFKAADALYWYYLDSGDEVAASCWARIAYENGSVAGRHNFASMLADSNERASLLRAKFHLSALVELGDETAFVLLQKVNKKLEKLVPP